MLRCGVGIACVASLFGHFCVTLRVVVFGRLVSLPDVCAFPMNAVCEAGNQCTVARTRTCHVAMASGFKCAHKVLVRGLEPKDFFQF